MERNPQDQNLGDAPDDQNKIFNPANVLSEPKDKKPVGPSGTQKDDRVTDYSQKDDNAIGQSNRPIEKDADEDNKPEGGKTFKEATDPDKLSDL